MSNSTRRLGVFVCLASLFLLLQTQALPAQQPDMARKAAAASAAPAAPLENEPQAAGRSASSPPQVIPALPVPRLVKFSGTLKVSSGQPRTGVVGLTFSIYSDQEGGSTLWMETHNVELDEQGRYSVLLGSRQSEGMPLELFATGEPRWLGVKVELPGEVEQARVLLVSVPYALKAVDAESLGGKPASAYALAPSATTEASATEGATRTTTGATKNALTKNATTAGFIPVFTDNAGTVGNSVMIQSGSAIGIGQIPVQTLDVSGGVRGSGLATGGRNTAPDAINTAALFLGGSNAMGLIGTNNAAFAPGVLFTKVSFFAGNGTTTAERITVDGLTGNVGIGTTTPGHKLDVAGNVKLSGGGSLIFPDNTMMSTAATGAGTITAVNTAAGSGLMGGATTGAANLSLLTTCNNNQLLKFVSAAWACANDNNSGGTVTNIATGTGLTGGPIAFNGTVSLDTVFTDGRYAQLAAPNTFSAVQTFDASTAINGFAALIKGSIYSPGIGFNGQDAVRVLQVSGYPALNAMSTPPSFGGTGISASVNCSGCTGTAVNQGVHVDATTNAGGAIGALISASTGAGTSKGVSATAGDYGVFAQANNSTGTALYGAGGSAGYGVYAGGGITGVYGTANATNGIGVQGAAYAATEIGVMGVTNTGSAGVFLASQPSGKILVGETGNPLSPTIEFRVDTSGNVFANGSYNCGLATGCFNTGIGADVAERIDVTESLEPGDVVEINPDSPGRFRRVRGAYSTMVAGIVSTAPGVTLGNNDLDHNDTGVRTDARPLLALVGRVPVNVTAEGGAIRIGDLLTSSSTPGHAMRCADRHTCAGAIVGKSLESFNSPLDSAGKPIPGATGVVMVLVTLQ